MPQSTDKFYNLQIDLVSNGQKTTEKAGVSSIVEKDDTAFFYIYIYRLDKSFVFEKHFISKIYDISHDKIYTDMDIFISDFKKATYEEASPLNTTEEEPVKNKNFDFLAPIYSDVVILLFFAENDVDDNNLKLQVVNEYIQKKIPQAQNLSSLYINKCLNSLETSNNDFYQAIPKLFNKSKNDLSYFIKTLIKICLSDGRLHYTERLYLAEIMQMFREHNVDLPEDFKVL